MSAPVRLEVAARRATVRLEGPPLHILDIPTIEALDATLAELGRREDVHLVVLRGAGGKAFSAGVSIQDHTPDKVERMLTGFHGAIRRLRALDAVTLAAVDGHCLGGGMELALACDLVLASEESTFGLPEIKLGCYPPVAAALLPRRIGPHKTLELALLGHTLPSAELAALGLLNWRVPRAGFEAKLDEVAEGLLAMSGAVAKLTKRAVRAGEAEPFGAALDEAERLYLQDLCATADIAEGIAAFLAKRAPEWKHR